MENRSEVLMLSGVTAFCADCGGQRIFVPVDEECLGESGPGGAHPGCEFCCTSCDAAVFLLEVLDNTRSASGSLACAI